jgi:hypothetical protein
MNPGGWFMMVLSVGTVVILFGWCLYRVLTLPPEDARKHLHGELDIDTHEQD